MRETNLSANDFVLPLFVSEKIDRQRPILSMPGVSQFSINEIANEAQRAQDLGLQAVLIFGIPQKSYISRYLLEMCVLSDRNITIINFIISQTLII